ncbi:MAG: hypothetical protein QM689_12785 [Oscillospiraceae bacterium]
MSEFKGIAEITLRDAVTGKITEQHRDENMITNAVKNLLTLKAGYFRGNTAANPCACTERVNANDPQPVPWASAVSKPPDGKRK